MGLTADTGSRGEEVAGIFLAGEGFDILHRNWRSGHWEIDIVARKGDMLHIVEVKTRRARALTSPEEAMTARKFDLLCKAANAYINIHGLDLEVQFDLVAVELDGENEVVRYIPNVMTPRW